jgi:hypothetical protein
MSNNASPSTNAITLHQLFYIIASLFFLTSAFCAIYYYKERCLYIDSAFQLFKIISNENFNIEAFRFGVVFTQILPLIAIKAGLPLKAILLIFSLSFLLVDYLVFLICYHFLNEKTVSFLIPAALIIGISHAWFYVVTELYQAIVFVILFYAWVNTRFAGKNSNKQLAGNLAIALVIFLQCFFCHPMSIFAVLFIIGYHVLYTKQNLGSQVLVLLPFILLVTVLKYFVTDSSSYEGNLFGNFVRIPSLLSEHQIPYPLTFVLHHTIGIYAIPFLLFILLVAHYIYYKKYRLLSFLGITFLSFLGILALTFSKGGDDIEMEKTFALPLLFILIPVSKEIVFYNQNYKFTKAFIFLAIVGTGFWFIQKAGTIYQTRISYLDALLDKTKSQKGNKFIMERKEVNEIIRIPWAVSVETLLYSALTTPGDQRSIYISSDQHEFSRVDLKDPKLFLLTSFWLTWGEPLNKKYFNLKSYPYQWLKKEDLFKNQTYRVVKEVHFDQTLNLPMVADSLGSGSSTTVKKAFFLESTSEFSLPFESKIGSITTARNPVFSIQVDVFTRDAIENEKLFLVLSVQNGKHTDYYQAIDIGKSLYIHQWTLISRQIDLISVHPDDIIKIYLWNHGFKNYYVDKMAIAFSE